MLNNAQTYVLYAPWVAVYPGFMITVTVLSFNFAGRLAGCPGSTPHVS